MSMTRRTITATTVAILLILLLAVAVNAQGIWETARNLRVNNLESLVTFRSTGSAVINAATIDTGTVTDLTSSLITVDSLMATSAAMDTVVMVETTIQPGTTITATDAATITLSAAFQPLVAAGTVTPVLAAPSTAGQRVTLINTSAQTINLADSGTARLSAAWAAGQYDTLTLMAPPDLAAWVEVARSNN